MLFVVLLVFALTLKAAEASTNEDLYWSMGSSFGILFGALAICLLLVAIVLTCMKYYKLWLQRKRDKILTTNAVHETTQDPNLMIRDSRLAVVPQFPSSFTPQRRSQQHPSTFLYPPLDSFVYQNSMTTAPAVFRCQADSPTIPYIGTNVAVSASAPPEPTLQGDLSGAGLFQRLFRPKPQGGNGHSPHSSFDSAIRLSLTPSDLSRTSRISVAFRDAIRNLRSNIPFGTGSRNSDDTVVLEEGTAAPLPSRDSASGSQTHMFKQRRTKKISGISSGSSRIGWRGKVSAAEDLGQYNIEQNLGETESTADNDRFLYSLESAVFTTATEEVPTLYARPPNSSFDGTSSAVSRSQEGDASEARQPSPLVPYLPPGLPVIGFAFRGFEDEDEDNGGTSQEISVPEKSQRLQNSASEHGTVLARGTTLAPADDPLTFDRPEATQPDGATPAQQCDEIRASNRLVHAHQQLAQHHSSAGSANGLFNSANSASAMFASSRSRSHEDLPRRQSASSNGVEIHPPSDHRGSAGIVEHWMIASDEYLLISPGDESHPESQGGHPPLRSRSSSDLQREAH